MTIDYCILTPSDIKMKFMVIIFAIIVAISAKLEYGWNHAGYDIDRISNLPHWSDYGLFLNNKNYWTAPDIDGWKEYDMKGGEVTRIIIAGNKIYGIGPDQAVYENNVESGQQWKKIAEPAVKDLAYWNGQIYGLGLKNKIYWTVPNTSNLCWWI